eukprot:COSAG01_NODE_11604_length_1896_cov_1.005008_2_plen_94_part_01
MLCDRAQRMCQTPEWHDRCRGPIGHPLSQGGAPLQQDVEPQDEGLGRALGTGPALAWSRDRGEVVGAEAHSDSAALGLLLLLAAAAAAAAASGG